MEVMHHPSHNGHPASAWQLELSANLGGGARRPDLCLQKPIEFNSDRNATKPVNTYIHRSDAISSHNGYPASAWQLESSIHWC